MVLYYNPNKTVSYTPDNGEGFDLDPIQILKNYMSFEHSF